jgi:WXG100 family type VII secretion target
MAQFTVTPQALLSAASQCTNTAGYIQQNIQQVTTYVDTLIADGYKGPCATQLGNLASNWGVDANNLVTLLNDIASNLTTNANNYGGSESQNTTNLVKITTNLPSGNF